MSWKIKGHFPLGERIAFRLYPSQQEQLERYRLEGDGDNIQRVFNRQLLRLQQAIDNNKPPKLPSEAGTDERRGNSQSFRPDQRVEALILQMQEGNRFQSKQEVIDYLLGWSFNLPAIEAVHTLQDAYAALVDRFGLSFAPVSLGAAVDYLFLRCSYETIRQLLWQLNEHQYIRLRESAPGHENDPKIRLLSTSEKTYRVLEFAPKVPQVSLSDFRNESFTAQPQLDSCFAITVYNSTTALALDSDQLHSLGRSLPHPATTLVVGQWRNAAVDIRDYQTEVSSQVNQIQETGHIVVELRDQRRLHLVSVSEIDPAIVLYTPSEIRAS